MSILLSLTTTDMLYECMQPSTLCLDPRMCQNKRDTVTTFHACTPNEKNIPMLCFRHNTITKDGKCMACEMIQFSFLQVRVNGNKTYHVYVFDVPTIRLKYIMYAFYKEYGYTQTFKLTGKAYADGAALDEDANTAADLRGVPLDLALLPCPNQHFIVLCLNGKSMYVKEVHPSFPLRTILWMARIYYALTLTHNGRAVDLDTKLGDVGAFSWGDEFHIHPIMPSLA